MDKNLSVSKKIQKLFQSDYKYAVYIRDLVSYFVYFSEEHKRTEDLKYLDLKEYLLEIIKKQIASFETYHENNQVLFKQIFNVEEVDIKLLSSTRKIPVKLPKEIETNVEIKVSGNEEMLIDLEARLTRIEKEFLTNDKKYKDTYEFAVEAFLDYVKKYLQKPTAIELEEYSEKYSNGKISKSEWARNFEDPIFNSILEKEFIKLINKTSIDERKDSFGSIFNKMHEEFYEKLLEKIEGNNVIHLEDMNPILQDKVINASKIAKQYEDQFPRTMGD